MAVISEDYSSEDVIQFLKEEFERISTQYPLQRTGSLSDAQAFEIWFLRQELGFDYEEAVKHVLDGPNDCGVDFIVVDDYNHEVIIGQAEYDPTWSSGVANSSKCIETFRKFQDYLRNAAMPDELPDYARDLWRLAKSRKGDGYGLRYVYITPKRLSSSQQDFIRRKSGLSNYDFITHDLVVKRGGEFLDGQTGMCNFELHFGNVLHIRNDFGNVYVANVDVKEIHRIVDLHRKQKRLAPLFASNVRTFLSKKKRSRDIADAMKETLSGSPQDFLICNNGITIQCSRVVPKKHSLLLERASISNGCQTAMNIDQFFRENDGSNPSAQVLVTIVELTKDADRLSSNIARSRNNQNPVDNRDLMSNNFRLVCLHHRLLADRMDGSNRNYYLVRKAGEKDTLLKEWPEARGKFIWIDAAELAQCIAAVIRQEPYLSTRGASELFGKYFYKIFPEVSDPTHSRAKYSWWLYKTIDASYDGKSRWSGIKDDQIYFEKDFKNPALWILAALTALKLKEDFNFDENFEERFVRKCERWHYRRRSRESEEFIAILNDIYDNGYLLIHSLARGMRGKPFPKTREVYTNYDDLLKAPGFYDAILTALRRGKSKTYKRQFWHSLLKLYEYLKVN